MTDAERSPAPVPQPTLRSADPADCTVLLIRHARSADVVPGSAESADPPLHAEGERQVALLAARLSGLRIDGVYSSHLTRAHRTAAPLAAERGLQVQVHHDLEEVRLGDWGHGEFRRRAATLDPEWVAWSRTGRWDGIPGGERDDEVRARFAAVVDALAEQHRGGTIAVVAHGGVIGAYLAHLLGTHRSMWLTVENTSITHVRIGPLGATVVAANDCHHLYDTVTGAPRA